MGILCLALVGTALAKEIEERSFSMSSEGSVSVKNVAGSIAIQGWEQEKVKMIATREGPEADKIAIEIDVKKESLRINTRYPMFPGIKRSWIDYELWVLSGATVRAESVSGDIRIEGQRSDVRTETTSGDIELIDIAGDLDVRTISGDIYTKGSEGMIIVHSTSGKVKILEARGQVPTIETVSGDIWVELESIDDAASRMNFKSVSGTINLFLPPDTAASIDMSTVSGKLSSDLPILIKESLSTRELRGTIGEGGPLIKLKTISGDISLRKL